MLLFHVSVHPQSAQHTKCLLKHFKWAVFHHPPYSPYLSLSDYYMFLYLRKTVGSRRLRTNCEVRWLLKMD